MTTTLDRQAARKDTNFAMIMLLYALRDPGILSRLKGFSPLFVVHRNIKFPSKLLLLLKRLRLHFLQLRSLNPISFPLFTAQKGGAS